MSTENKTAFPRALHTRRATLAALILALQAQGAWAQNSTEPSPDEVDGKSTESAAKAPVSKVKILGKASPYIGGARVGGKEEQSLREIPNSVSVLTQQRIEEQNLVTVADALNQITGVTVISNDSTQSQYYSRGYGLGIMNDGIPSYNSSSGYQQFDLAVYEQIEVLRGPAGIFQGSGDPGGEVNLVRKRAKDSFALSGDVSMGSWNNYRGVADVTGPLNADKTVRGRAVVAVQDRDYFYDRTHTNKYVGYGTLEWDLTPRTTVSIAATYQNDDTKSPYSGLPAWTTGGLLDVDRSTNPYPDWTKTQWETKDVIAELTHRFDNQWQAKVRLNHRDQSLYFKDAYPSSGVNPDTNTVKYARRQYDYDYQRDAVDLFLTGPFSLLGRTHHAVVGYNYDRFAYDYVGVKASAVSGVPLGRSDQVSSFDAAYTLGGESKTEQSGFYGQARFSISDPLTLVLGARISDFDSKSRSAAPSTPTEWKQGAKEDRHVTPYGAIVYAANKAVSLYASYAGIFIPTTSLQASGNTLKPREGRQFELGSKGEFFDGKLIASIAVFDLRDTNRPYSDPNNPDYYLAAGEVESKGYELEVAGSPAPGWQVQAGYTWLDTSYLKDDSDQGLTYDTWEPKNTFKLWGTKKFSGGALDGLSLGLGTNIVSGTQAGTGTWAVRAQGGYSVWNALVSYPINRKLSVSFNANNLFDTKYYTRLGGLNTYNTYGEPRNFSLSFNAKY